VGNLADWNPLARTQKKWEIKVNADVDFYKKPEITAKHSEKLPKNAKSNQLLKTERTFNTKI